MVKGKIKFPKPIGKPALNGPWIRTVEGIKWTWTPNPRVKNGGYWRRLPEYLQ